MEELENMEPDQLLAKEEAFFKELTTPKTLHSRILMWDFKEKWEQEVSAYEHLVVE